MKRIIAVATCVLLASGATYFANAWAQNADPAGQPEAPHRIGLIDLAEVFQKYEKFGVLRDDLKVEISESDQKARGMEQKLRELTEIMKKLNEGSADYIEKEKQLAQASAEFQAFRAFTQKEIARKEAKIYHTIQLEVQDAVDRFCKHYHYTLVLRYSREDMSSSDPQKVLQSLNSLVVYHRDTDDCTDAVLRFLNDRYQGQSKNSTGTKKAATPPREATKPKTSTPR